MPPPHFFSPFHAMSAPRLQALHDAGQSLWLQRLSISALDMTAS